MRSQIPSRRHRSGRPDLLVLVVAFICSGLLVGCSDDPSGPSGPLTAEVARRAFRPAVERCKIVPGELTGTAGVYGAVAAFKVACEIFLPSVSTFRQSAVSTIGSNTMMVRRSGHRGPGSPSSFNMAR